MKSRRPSDSFMKIYAVKPFFFYGRKMKFRNLYYISRPIWIKFGTANAHRKLFSNDESHVNQRALKVHTLPTYAK
jgi:hypothetical protein